MSFTILLLVLTLGCNVEDRVTTPGRTAEATNLVVEPSASTLVSGETVGLEATPQDADGNIVFGYSVSWASGDSTVATVDGDGTVTAEAGGSTRITATAEKDGQSLSGQADVTVEEAGSGGGDDGGGDDGGGDTDPVTGSLEIVTTTSGEDQDPSGYSVSVDDGSGQAIGLNGSVTFSDLATGDHSVQLFGVASNCTVTGDNPRTVSVVEGDTTSTTYDVRCQAIGGGDLADVVIPSASDWTVQGEVVPLGAPGEWDHRIDGSFTQISVQKRNGTLYLYYIGADGDRADGGPANRAVGYATSTDGLNWTKAGAGVANPLILDQKDPENDEQGHFSGAMWSDGGTIHFMSGTMAKSVDGSGDYWTSTDGTSWSVQQRDVIDPRSNAIGNDENFPIAAYEYGDSVFVYYIAKGGGIREWSLSLAEGPGWDDLPAHTNLRSTASYNARAGGEIIKKNGSTFLLPVADDDRTAYIYSFSPGSPKSLTLEETWPQSAFDSDFIVWVLYLDRELEKWFIYWNTGDDGVGIKAATAPMRRAQ